MKARAELYREMPSVDELLRSADVAELAEREGQAAVANACRAVLARLRTKITAGYLDGEKLRVELSNLRDAVQEELGRALSYSLRAVINATGVILHTNLGRAPIGAAALQHISETAGTYSNIEFDLDSGERGKRDVHVDRLFRKLLSLSTGEDARASMLQTDSFISTIVVNNNAGCRVARA